MKYIFELIDRLLGCIIVLVFGMMFYVVLIIFMVIGFIWDFKNHSIKEDYELKEIFKDVINALKLKVKLTKIIKETGL